MPLASSGGASNIGSGQITDDSIINDDINSAAAIALSKLAANPLAPAIVIATKNTADANTTDNYAHGLGRTPVLVKFFVQFMLSGTEHNLCVGIFCAAGQKSIWSTLGGTATSGSDATHGVVLPAGNAPGTKGVVGTISVDGTNVSIAWVKAGTPTGTYPILMEIY